MNRPNYIDIFSIPKDYKPPDDGHLSEDKQYPNLNSKDYQKKSSRNGLSHPYYEVLCSNEEGEYLLACNDIRGRIWDGNLIGFKDIEALENHVEGFNTPSVSPITNVKYISKRIIVITQANGSVQVFSTKSKVREWSNYCLFVVGEKTEHVGIVLSMDTFPSNPNIIVTGCSDACLKIWDSGEADLFSLHTLRYAHSSSITGISCNPESTAVFATSSSDKSSLIWDYRDPRPATALYEDHHCSFTSVYWPKSEEMNQALLLGDETGFVYTVDPRVPNELVEYVPVFNRPVRKMKFCSNQLAVIGNTNTVKVYKSTEASKFELVYKDSQANNLLRDCLWADNNLFTIGWNRHSKKHVIDS